MEIIAHIRTDFPEKFGIPRQSSVLEKLTARVEFTEAYSNPDFIRGIEGFSHLWLIWDFSEVPKEKTPSPTVRPPRLGGNKRLGVFATRSPFRPNPIGLSSVRLIRVENLKNGAKSLVVSGADLVDGTPIYDIKPYLAYTDSHPDAAGGFTEEKWRELSVVFPEALLKKIPEEKREGLIAALSADPRPPYQNDPGRVYKMAFAGKTVSFRVEEQNLIVTEVKE